jgi:nitrogen fixation protein NifU and related proteins
LLLEGNSLFGFRYSLFVRPDQVLAGQAAIRRPQRVRLTKHKRRIAKSEQRTANREERTACLTMYSAEVLDHFQHPRNCGELSDASGRARIENPACGDVLELAVKIADGRIADIRFRAQGCVAAMACASAITELAKGKSVEQARALDRHAVIAVVGSLPPASGHAAQLAIDALRAVLKAAK